jgi:hypothetical protein
MENLFDEFSKSLAESVPRRESLRRLGAVFAGAVLSPLRLNTAWAGKKVDPCTAFCNQRCSTARRPNCLVWCRACNNDPSRLCGDCWSGLRCCGTAETCCYGRTCHNLKNDFVRCGACGNSCDAPGPYEVGACLDGSCEYWCVQGAVDCNGACSLLDRDPDNCGACGNICPDSAPDCIDGTCGACGGGSTNCGGYCAFLSYDPYNCGACGFVCPGTGCTDGQCDFGVPGE